MTSFIEVLGLYPDPKAWSPLVHELTGQAQVLAGGARLLGHFPGHAGQRVELRAPLSQAMAAIAQARGQGLNVVVLADGDPLYFGIGRMLLEHFPPTDLRFYPGVTAVALAAARLKRPWQDLAVVSLHGREDFAPLLAALAHRGAVAVYTGPGGTPGDIARVLVEQGLEEARLWVFEDMAGEGENLRQLSAAQAVGQRFAALNLVLAEVPEPSRLLPGLSDEAMPSGLYTKWPVRACSLASLRLHARARLWDVGAGSGAVAIEASARLPQGSVWAVERHPGRVQAMRENIRAAKAWQVRVVCGQAPQALAGLPQPDRIFLGGGLDQGLLPELCARLAPGGRLVANVVLLSSLNQCLEHFRNLGWPVEVAQVQASVAKPLAGDLRLTAQNPVFILAADKPA